MAEIENYDELNRAITKESGFPIVTKWLILAEVVDDHGDRLLMHLSSDDCLLWDQLGMVENHRQWVQSRSNPIGDE